jgi:hypothetical protein
VQERIQIVRRYQLVHPDECTEAMKRLAQAYVSLAVSQQQPVAAIPAPVVGPSIPLESLLPPPPAPAPTAPSPVAPPQPKASTAPAPGMPSNQRTIYHRLARVRRLLRAWRGVEHYLGDSGWRIARRGKREGQKRRRRWTMRVSFFHGHWAAMDDKWATNTGPLGAAMLGRGRQWAATVAWGRCQWRAGPLGKRRQGPAVECQQVTRFSAGAKSSPAGRTLSPAGQAGQGSGKYRCE